MKNIIYLILIILVSLPISCDDPNEGNNYAVRDGDPVGTWLEKNENFSEWVSLLRKTNMFSILNVKNIDLQRKVRYRVKEYLHLFCTHQPSCPGIPDPERLSIH